MKLESLNVFHEDWSEILDSSLEQLQNDWAPSNPPDICLYLPKEEPLRTFVLSTLVVAHLELSIRSATTETVDLKTGTLTEHYLMQYPQLRLCRAIVLDLFAKEYKFRRRKEPNLDWASFLSTVPVEFRDGLRPSPRFFATRTQG